MFVKFKLIFHHSPFLAIAHSPIRNPTSASESGFLSPIWWQTLSLLRKKANHWGTRWQRTEAQTPTTLPEAVSWNPGVLRTVSRAERQSFLGELRALSFNYFYFYLNSLWCLFSFHKTEWSCLSQWLLSASALAGRVAKVTGRVPAPADEEQRSCGGNQTGSVSLIVCQHDELSQHDEQSRAIRSDQPSPGISCSPRRAGLEVNS